MRNNNELIYAVRKVLGDETNTGFFTTIDDNIKVPNYLFKDIQSEYPEIRIFPFINGHKKLSFNYPISKKFRNIKDIYKTEFQIDIYSKSIPQLNKIYREIENRIDDFTKIDTIIYGYNTDYIDTGDYYKNTIYENNNFSIGWISIDGITLIPVCSVNDLVDNSWYLGNDGLYIKTDLNIKKIEVMSIYNGRMFPNNTTLYSIGVYTMRINNVMELSDLEDNEVERLMVEILIIYGLDHERKNGPLVEHIDIGAKNG